MTPLLPKRLHMTLPGDKLYKLANLLMMAEPETLYHRLISLWDNPTAVALGSVEPRRRGTRSCTVGFGAGLDRTDNVSGYRDLPAR